MFNLKKYDLKIAGKRKTVVGIEYTPEMLGGVAGPMHHVHIIDRSGSMYSHINKLINQVQETFRIINDNDYYSVIWFSSPGEFKTLIKGAKKTDDVKKLLDSIRYTLGSTCFSESVKEARTIASDLKMLCPNISMTLFTDGEPVVPYTDKQGRPWGPAKEIERTIAEVVGMKNDILAFNTIGYGYGYNRNFLVNLAQASQHGSMMHSNNISEYFALFNKNKAKVEGMAIEPVEIESQKSNIVYFTSKSTKMEAGGMNMANLHTGKNHFFIVPEDSFARFTLNGKIYDVASVPAATVDDDVKTFYYAYAYNQFYLGNRSVALDVLANNVKDKYLVEKQINVFTNDEIQNYLNILEAAVLNAGPVTARMIDGVLPAGYLPKANALCVMDVLTMLAQGDNYYVPFSKLVPAYERIGKKTVDEDNIFVKSDDEVLASLTNFVWNKDKLNLSIGFKINGTVKLNKKAAERVGLDENFPSHISRAHTLIKDGNMNVKQAEFKLDKITYDKFYSMKVPMRMIRMGSEPDIRVILEFTKLPVINRMYIDKSTDIDAIFDAVVENTAMEAYKKVLNAHLDKVTSAMPSMAKVGEFAKLNLDQIQVLTDHGIDKSLSYGGMNKKTESKDDCYQETVRTMAFYLKGVSALPSLAEVEKGKKGIGHDMIRESIKEINAHIAQAGLSMDKPTLALRDMLTAQKKKIDVRLAASRARLNTLKLAKLITGDWFQGLKTDEKGNNLYEKNGITMIARADRTTEYRSAA